MSDMNPVYNTRFSFIPGYRLLYSFVIIGSVALMGSVIYLQNFGALIIWSSFLITLLFNMCSYSLTDSSLDVQNIIMKHVCKKILYDQICRIEYHKNKKNKLDNIYIHYTTRSATRCSWIKIPRYIDLEAFLVEIQNRTGAQIVEK